MSIQQLNITKSGNGSGTVTSNVGTPAVDCGDTCTVSQTSGSSVTLTATPDSRSTFIGWSGDIPTSSSNPVTYTQTLNPTNINAEFRRRRRGGKAASGIGNDLCIHPGQFLNIRPLQVHQNGKNYSYIHTNYYGFWCYRLQKDQRSIIGLGFAK